MTGSYSDGPEWGQQPYTNMFAADAGSVDPKYPVNTQAGAFFKSHGAKVLGTYGYGISPSSSRAAVQTAQSFQHAGGKVGVARHVHPVRRRCVHQHRAGGQAGPRQRLAPEMDSNSNYALATALKQAGVQAKGLFATGYEPDVINSPAWSSLQGDYFASLYRPWVLPDAGTEQMQAAMEKYAHFTKSDFPTFSQYEAWAGADLMIKGLRAGGPQPDQGRRDQGPPGPEVLQRQWPPAQSIDYATVFGHDEPQQCTWVMQAEKTGFTPVSSKPFCGTDIPGTSTATS